MPGRGRPGTTLIGGQRLDGRKSSVFARLEEREPQAGGGARWPPFVLSAGPDGRLPVKFQVGPRQRGNFLLTGHATG